MQRIAFHAMGCQMMAAIDSALPSDQARLEEVPGWFENWEQHLSRFRPDSELSRINRGSGNQVISSVMAQVLREALVAQHQSKGLVNPLLLNAIEAAGYDRNFADLPARITTQSDLQPMRQPMWQPMRQPMWQPMRQDWDLALDSDNRMLNLPPGGCLDFGGIAKGWAADQAACRLGKLAPALVDAGGDIAASAPQVDGSPWLIGVANPFDPDEQLDLVLLWEGGVATSGRDYRRWRKDGRWQHHIIDPRTGKPAMTDVLSATIIAPSTRMAETAAKSVVILGSFEALAWLDERPALAGLLVLEDGAIIPSRNWPDHIWS